MNSTALPSRYFGTHRHCFAAAILTWPAYGDGRQRENRSVWKDRIIVASTCRRSVQFGFYITRLCMASRASVMTKMLPLYNFTIPCRGKKIKLIAAWWSVARRHLRRGVPLSPLHTDTPHETIGNRYSHRRQEYNFIGIIRPTIVRHGAQRPPTCQLHCSNKISSLVVWRKAASFADSVQFRHFVADSIVRWCDVTIVLCCLWRRTLVGLDPHVQIGKRSSPCQGS